MTTPAAPPDPSRAKHPEQRPNAHQSPNQNQNPEESTMTVSTAPSSEPGTSSRSGTGTGTTARSAPWTAAVSAGITALMVLGGFAMMAVAPVAVTLISSLANARLRVLRWWSVALAGIYSTGLVIWAVRPDPAPSLTRDLHPALTVLIVAAALAVVVRHLVQRRSAARGRA